MTGVQFPHLAVLTLQESRKNFSLMCSMPPRMSSWKLCNQLYRLLLGTKAWQVFRILFRRTGGFQIGDCP